MNSCWNFCLEIISSIPLLLIKTEIEAVNCSLHFRNSLFYRKYILNNCSHSLENKYAATHTYNLLLSESDNLSHVVCTWLYSIKSHHSSSTSSIYLGICCCISNPAIIYKRATSFTLASNQT